MAVSLRIMLSFAAVFICFLVVGVGTLMTEKAIENKMDRLLTEIEPFSLATTQFVRVLLNKNAALQSIYAVKSSQKLQVAIQHDQDTTEKLQQVFGHFEEKLAPFDGQFTVGELPTNLAQLQAHSEQLQQMKTQALTNEQNILRAESGHNGALFDGKRSF